MAEAGAAAFPRCWRLFAPACERISISLPPSARPSAESGVASGGAFPLATSLSSSGGNDTSGASCALTAASVSAALTSSSCLPPRPTTVSFMTLVCMHGWLLWMNPIPIVRTAVALLCRTQRQKYSLFSGYGTLSVLVANRRCLTCQSRFALVTVGRARLLCLR